MIGRNMTRAHLIDGVYRKVGLSRGQLVDQVIGEICNTLAAGKAVKLSSFGIFTARKQGKCIGGHPATNVAEVSSFNLRDIHHVPSETRRTLFPRTCSCSRYSRAAPAAASGNILSTATRT